MKQDKFISKDEDLEKVYNLVRKFCKDNEISHIDLILFLAQSFEMQYNVISENKEARSDILQIFEGMPNGILSMHLTVKKFNDYLNCSMGEIFNESYQK